MKRLIEWLISSHLRRSAGQAPPYSGYRRAQGYRALRHTARKTARDGLFITAGIASAGFGLESFLLPNRFIDGGVTGISLLITEVFDLPLPLLILLINIPFIVLGHNVINRAFAVRTVLAIAGLSALIATVHFPHVTDDKLLAAVFGGFFIGAGIGLTVRGGAVIDGTEVLAIFLSRRLSTTIGDFIMVINILIFSCAAYFLGINVAMYSMITYLAASKTLDFVTEGIEEYLGVTIISPLAPRIRQMITEKMERGVTMYKGNGGYGKRGELGEIDILYTIITRLELNRLKSQLKLIDPNAFIVMTSVKEVRGGMIKKRRLH